jgi:hypothetical protein
MFAVCWVLLFIATNPADDKFPPNLSPPFLPDAPFLSQEVICSLPPPIHVDQSFSNLSSLLNLSLPSYSDVTRRRQIGSSVAVKCLFQSIPN